LPEDASANLVSRSPDKVNFIGVGDRSSRSASAPRLSELEVCQWFVNEAQPSGARDDSPDSRDARSAGVRQAVPGRPPLIIPGPRVRVPPAPLRLTWASVGPSARSARGAVHTGDPNRSVGHRWLWPHGSTAVASLRVQGRCGFAPQPHPRRFVGVGTGFARGRLQMAGRCRPPTLVACERQRRF
jgi:hypothetical protein